MANKTIKQLATEITDVAPDDWFLVQRDSDSVTGKAKASNVFSGGWTPLSVAPSTITHNGNRSYSITFPSVNYTSATYLGMRLKLTRTVTAPTYMGGAFNGSSHYFLKSTPSGTLGTVTNNFTLAGHVQPTTYQTSWVAGRFDSSGNNGFGLKMESTGAITVAVVSGGSANFRQISTYQSVPLNKKTHVVATWTSGTVVIYFDGVSVPVAAATTGGTAPTTAGTGGDFAIGRKGASNAEYFAGYIAGVGVFDAVLSAATVKTLSGQALSGSETNNIGAWNLNNAATDANASANNLTATGGVGYTAQSCYTNSVANTSITAGTTNYTIITAQSYSTDTTYTVQVAEGETLPTSGGITAAYFSTQDIPYGFVRSKTKWRVKALYRQQLTQSSPSSGTWYNLTTVSGTSGGTKLNVPIGAWKAKYSGSVIVNNGTNPTSGFTTLSTTSSTETDTEMTVRPVYMSASGGVTGAAMGNAYRDGEITVTTATDYFLNIKTDVGSASQITFGPSSENTIIEVELAYI